MAAVIQPKGAHIRYWWLYNRFIFIFHTNKWTYYKRVKIFLAKIVEIFFTLSYVVPHCKSSLSSVIAIFIIVAPRCLLYIHIVPLLSFWTHCHNSLSLLLLLANLFHLPLIYITFHVPTAKKELNILANSIWTWSSHSAIERFDVEEERKKNLLEWNI